MMLKHLNYQTAAVQQVTKSLADMFKENFRLKRAITFRKQHKSNKAIKIKQDDGGGDKKKRTPTRKHNKKELTRKISSSKETEGLTCETKNDKVKFQCWEHKVPNITIKRMKKHRNCKTVVRKDKRSKLHKIQAVASNEDYGQKTNDKNVSEGDKR